MSMTAPTIGVSVDHRLGKRECPGEITRGVEILSFAGKGTLFGRTAALSYLEARAKDNHLVSAFLRRRGTHLSGAQLTANIC
jgi:hypothetical protein